MTLTLEDWKTVRLADYGVFPNLTIFGSANLPIQEIALTFYEWCDFVEKRLKDVLVAQLIDRRSAFHRALVLDDAASASAVDAQDGNGFVLRRLERKLDEVVG